MNTQTLPIQAVIPDIQNSLQQHDQLVLQAPPGAGKTTMVPLALLNEPWLANQKILMLEPRRMAARTAAERMASLLDEKVGDTVGYRIRQENRISRKTRIEVITEGVLTRMLQEDPELNGVGLIIFDEYHERNLNSDLGLALCLQARELFREAGNPLKLLVMSATLDGVAVAELLDDAPVLRSEGKMFAVDIHYGKTVKTNEPLVVPVVDTVLQALDETSGSVLVFLPGQGEVMKVHKSLSALVSGDVAIFPLYGALSLKQQMQAIAPLDNNATYQRKVVLATDIAETSLTIDGISTVVDSGLCRLPRFDPATGMTRLHTRRISQASSIQRMGRAGRTQAGHCYRLWSEETQYTLEKQIAPEILQADLCPLVLQLLQWGISDSSELQWLDKPPQAAFNQGLDLLYSLGALVDKPVTGDVVSLANPKLSGHGRQMAQFPTHPRLAHMLIRAAQVNQVKTAAVLAVLLSDKDPLSQYGTDISAKVAVLLGDIPCEKQFRGWFERSQQRIRTFIKLSETIDCVEELAIDENDVIGWLISLAYPDRIAQRRNKKGERYLLSNRRAAILKPYDPLAAHEYLAIAELGGLATQSEDTIFSAAPLNAQLFQGVLASMVEDHQTLHWDEKSHRFVAEQQQRIGALVLKRQALQDIPIEAKRAALIDLVRQKGLAMLPWNKACKQWQARIECLRLHAEKQDEGGEKWPDVSDDNLLMSLEVWLQPFVDDINKIDDFKKLDLQACLSTLLPWPLPKLLDEMAPTTFKVPSGSNIMIDYSHSPPVLAVKLQEMFGCMQTPCIAGGKIPLLVHLLSPAGKPLQITQDLAGFWQGSYQSVKKEMKGRYPKHPWPDDPLQAQATRFTRHRRPVSD